MMINICFQSHEIPLYGYLAVLPDGQTDGLKGGWMEGQIDKAQLKVGHKNTPLPSVGDNKLQTVALV